MTISTSQSSQQNVLNGSTTQWTFNNKIFEANDLVVTLFDTLGTAYPFTQSGTNSFSNSTTGLSYTVSNIDVDSGPYITMSGPGTSGWTLDMRTWTPQLQQTSIKNQGPFLPELHEEFFDRITRETQDLYRRTYTFGIHGPDLEATPWTQLPSAAARANTNLGFDLNGLPQVSAALASATLSAQSIGQFLYPLVSTENSSMVVNYFYPVGNVLRYGADPTGVADSTTAFANALIAKPTGEAFAPAGTYMISRQLVIGNGQSLRGESVGSVTYSIVGATLTPFLLSGSYAGMSRFSISAAQSQTSGAFINATGFVVTISDFLLTGYWYGITMEGAIIYCERGSIRNAAPSATLVAAGILVQGGNDNYISDVVCDNVAGAIPLAGLQVTQSGGVFVYDSDFIHCQHGVLIDPGVGANIEWAFFDSVCGDTCYINAWTIAPQNGGTVYGLAIENCWGSSAVGRGFLMQGTSGGAVDGIMLSQFRALNNGSHGIDIEAGCNNVNLLGCSVVGNSTTTPLAAYGLYIAPNVNNIQVIGGHYGSGYGLADQQAYQIYIDTGTSDAIQIIGVRFQTIHGVLFFGNANPNSSVVRDCAGYVATFRGNGVIASGQSSVAITHGMSATPNINKSMVSLLSNLHGAGANNAWISAVSSTTITVSVDATLTANVSVVVDAKTNLGVGY